MAIVLRCRSHNYDVVSVFVGIATPQNLYDGALYMQEESTSWITAKLLTAEPNSGQAKGLRSIYVHYRLPRAGQTET